MQTVIVTINKTTVLNEVAKITAYTGKNLADDGTLYEKVFTTEEDKDLLDSYWTYAYMAISERFKRWIKKISDSSASIYMVLDLSDRYNPAFNDSISKSAQTFFVQSIVAQWFQITNKEESELYMNKAVGCMDDIVKKITYKDKPSRPTA